MDQKIEENDIHSLLQKTSSYNLRPVYGNVVPSKNKMIAKKNKQLLKDNQLSKEYAKKSGRRDEPTKDSLF